MLSWVGHCGLVGKILAWKHRGPGFNPRYREIHCGSNNHLKWRSSVTGTYPPVADLRTPRMFRMAIHETLSFSWGNVSLCRFGCTCTVDMG